MPATEHHFSSRRLCAVISRGTCTVAARRRTKRDSAEVFRGLPVSVCSGERALPFDAWAGLLSTPARVQNRLHR
jgi:hypothetical protein